MLPLKFTTTKSHEHCATNNETIEIELCHLDLDIENENLRVCENENKKDADLILEISTNSKG